LFYQNDGNDIIVTPNPASTAIYIQKNHSQAFNFIVFDLLGNKKLEGVSNSEISLTDLNKGIYQLVIQFDHKQFTKKIVKL
jgi:hypothetical protein